MIDQFYLKLIVLIAGYDFYIIGNFFMSREEVKDDKGRDDRLATLILGAAVANLNL